MSKKLYTQAGTDLNATETDGDATLYGGDGSECLRGNSYSNEIHAEGGSKQIWGGTGGDDTFYSESGNNGFWFGANDGNDTIINTGRNGHDALIMYDTKFSGITAKFDSNDLTVGIGSSLIRMKNWLVNRANRIQAFIAKDESGSGFTTYAWNNNRGADVNLFDSSVDSLVKSTKLVCLDQSDSYLRGSVRDDTIIGNRGNDQIWGGYGGNDILDGGAGSNTFWWSKDDGNDTVINSTSHDTVRLYGLNQSDISLATKNGTLTITAGNAHLDINNWADNGLQNLQFKDGTTDSVSHLLGKADKPHHLNIVFDYSMDSAGFFTPERKAELNAAASEWSSHLVDDFRTTPAGTVLNIKDLSYQHTYSYGNAIPGGNKSITLGQDVDDVVVYVGSFSSSLTNDLADTVKLEPSMQTQNISGELTSMNAYQPPAAELWFNRNTDWNYNNLQQIATHELGHVLGLDMGVKLFASQEVCINGKYQFVGSNAEAANFGNPVYMYGSDAGHPDGNTTISIMNYGAALPLAPTSVDFGMLKDMGYHTI